MLRYHGPGSSAMMWLLVVVWAVAGTPGCGGNLAAGEGGNVPDWVDAGVSDGPNPSAFWEDDPPPAYCGPDGGLAPPPPPLPGGTPECPDDKNREGCPCYHKGVSAPCWPGLRVNRNRGVCRDGTTTCVLHGELSLRWGPCEGYVLPEPGVELGAGSCACFSAGQWALDNLTPCLLTYPDGAVWAVSSYLEDGVARCPPQDEHSPPTPLSHWAGSMLTVDCAGLFRLCYTIKAGRVDSPQPGDCVVAESCTETWYALQNVPQTLSPLPGWVSSSPGCALRFKESGGYGEMSVQGLSVECEPIEGPGGEPRVFKRLSYCPLVCDERPDLALCQGCGYDGDGTF